MQRTFAWRTLFQSLFFSTLLFAIAAWFFWYSQDGDAALNLQHFAALYLFLIFFGLLQWMFQKNTLFKLTTGRPEPTRGEPAAATLPPQTETERLKRENHEQRLFVHLLSVFQRQGRLVDFLQEDLSLYEDGQIGAAVRTIHENCSKAAKRYLSPEPIMKQREGETVEIAPDFDRHAVQLVGNVVGQPPFRGIVRHRGWQLRSVSLPTLSESENPNIIAPAEVEIQ